MQRKTHALTGFGLSLLEAGRIDFLAREDAGLFLVVVEAARLGKLPQALPALEPLLLGGDGQVAR